MIVHFKTVEFAKIEEAGLKDGGSNSNQKIRILPQRAPDQDIFLSLVATLAGRLPVIVKSTVPKLLSLYWAYSIYCE